MAGHTETQLTDSRSTPRLVAERLGDRVRSFATHNEPWVTATIGHELGHFAPGLKDRAVAMQVSHHCLLSHGLAAKAMRSSRSNLDVGIVLNLSPVYSASDSPADRMVASREDGLLVRWYMDALLRGRSIRRIFWTISRQMRPTSRMGTCS